MQNFAIAPMLDETKVNLNYIISQTPQVWLDNKIADLNGTCLVWWDYIEELFATESINKMHRIYCELINFFANNSWEQNVPDLITKNDLDIIKKANQSKQKITTDTLF
jgi:non-ribosomal peptide synthetase component F